MDQSTAAIQSVQLVCNNATFGLYSAATTLQINGNILISPISIVYASLLIYLGARGKTKTNLDSALHFSDYFGSDSASVTAGFSDALSQLKVQGPSSTAFNNSSKDKSPKQGRNREILSPSSKDRTNFQLALANGIFVEESFSLDQNYLSNVTRSLRASLMKESFVRNSDAARGDINNWVDSRTGGKIKDLIPPGGVDASTRAVLVNAIYFKAMWETEFSPSRPLDFTMLSGRKANIDFMQLTKNFVYAEDKNLGFQYVEIPYKVSEVSLLVLLPKKTNGLRALEKKLTPELFSNLYSRADSTDSIAVKLPKFKQQSSFDLAILLKKIGISDIFTKDADLSGMAPAGNLQVSSAYHKTFIDVDEKGTEAAGASAIVVMARSSFVMRPRADPIEFKADHPFIYAIRHNPTKLVLFIGRVESF